MNVTLWSCSTTASDVALVEDPDELEVYGKEEKRAGTQLTSYSFEVSSTILECELNWGKFVVWICSCAVLCLFINLQRLDFYFNRFASLDNTPISHNSSLNQRGSSPYYVKEGLQYTRGSQMGACGPNPTRLQISVGPWEAVKFTAKHRKARSVWPSGFILL